jgi:xylulokinase
MSKNPVWVQLLSDILNRPVEVAASAEPGVLGAAMTAFVASGHYPDIVTAADAMVQAGSLFEPGPMASMMSVRYEKYADLIESLRPWWGA